MAKQSTSKPSKSSGAEKGIGGKDEYRRTGKAPTPENTGAAGKPTTPKTY